MTQPPVDYQSKSTKQPSEIGDLGAPQAVFDTVIGPNLRLKDNLLQLICCVAGVILGALIGMIFITDKLAGLCVGGFIGLIVGILGSGIYIGIHRFIKGVKRK